MKEYKQTIYTVQDFRNGDLVEISNRIYLITSFIVDNQVLIVDYDDGSLAFVLFTEPCLAFNNKLKYNLFGKSYD